MSYLATRGALGATTADKQPGGTDFIATWLGFKQAMETKLGIYRDASGRALTLIVFTTPSAETKIMSRGMNVFCIQNDASCSWP